jgi:ribosomal protein L35
MQHNFGKKRPKRKRRLSGDVEILGGDRDRMKRLLGR